MLFRSEKLTYALQALELILCDEGLAKHNGVSIPEYTGCEYCNGVTEWSEKLGADGKEVRFEFCPVCGRMIEEVQNDNTRKDITLSADTEAHSQS